MYNCSMMFVIKSFTKGQSQGFEMIKDVKLKTCFLSNN